MSKYDPQDRDSRRALADALLALFARAEFIEVDMPNCNERVFARVVPKTEGKVRVLIYSTIEGVLARGVGKDSIKVCAVYKGRSGERGIVSADRRVNRVGEVDDIAERVIDRMRQCWKATKTCPRCNCGAPQFKSKVRKAKAGRPASGGNNVCANFCWKTDAQLANDNAGYHSRSHSGGYRPTPSQGGGRWRPQPSTVRWYN